MSPSDFDAKLRDCIDFSAQALPVDSAARLRAAVDGLPQASGVGDQPSGISLRITAVDGQVVTDTIPGPDAGQVFAGSAQFK